MRQQLNELGSDKRFTFIGNFERYGYKRVHAKSNEYYYPTILLTNLEVCTNELSAKKIIKTKPITDHLWFGLTKGFQKLGFLQKGDHIQFNGRVSDYYKGYFLNGKVHDLKLSYPTKIQLLSKRDPIPLPKEKNDIIGLIMNLEWNFYIKNNRPIDFFYTNHFKKCKEAQEYDYGIKIH